MSESIEVSQVIPATPQAVYKAWLSAAQHGQMTGGNAATYDETEESFTAWDGYISGKTLERQPYSRLVQSWRTTEFGEDDPDSTLEVLLDPHPDGTLVTLKHSNIPQGQGESYKSGWFEHYFSPMTQHFQSTRARINQMENVVNEAADAATGVIESAGDQIEKTAKQAVKSVQKTAKKAQSAVKKFVAQAKKKFAGSTRPAAKKVSAVVKKVKARAKKAAPKKAAKKAAPKKAGAKKKSGSKR